MATNPPVPPVPGASAPMSVPPKKSNTLAWVLGGLGGCLVLVIIIVAGVAFFIAHKAKQAGIDGDSGVGGARVVLADELARVGAIPADNGGSNAPASANVSKFSGDL